MATVYKADNYAHPMPSCPGVGVTLTREFLYTVTAAFIINDTIKLCPIPGEGDVVVSEWFLDIPDLDSGGTPTFKLDLGDTDTAAKFVSANTTGQSAGFLHSTASGAVAASTPVEYTAAKDLILKVNTAPQTGATSGVIQGFMRYHYVGIASVL